METVDNVQQEIEHRFSLMKALVRVATSPHLLADHGDHFEDRPELFAEA
jgi:hypothetical protein